MAVSLVRAAMKQTVSLANASKNQQQHFASFGELAGTRWP
jgi:hypothetical protein